MFVGQTKTASVWVANEAWKKLEIGRNTRMNRKSAFWKI